MVNVVLRDVKGAFDRVWSEGLKYRILSLTPNVEKILCNFITNRKAIVEGRRSKGLELSFAAGVPQGTILSPPLYNIHITPIT